MPPVNVNSFISLAYFLQIMVLSTKWLSQKYSRIKYHFTCDCFLLTQALDQDSNGSPSSGFGDWVKAIFLWIFEFKAFEIRSSWLPCFIQQLEKQKLVYHNRKKCNWYLELRKHQRNIRRPASHLSTSFLRLSAGGAHGLFICWIHKTTGLYS